MDVTIEFPNMTDLLCEMADVFKKLEATKAELAAERAKPRGGVAWALKRKDRDEFWMFSSGDKYLYETKESASSYIRRAKTESHWEVVPYPISDGADELKAAIEAKEKAEAEVAAWKAAANFGAPLSIESPTDLAKRLADLDEWLENAKQTIAALKAAPAEVPPLDRWRVLSTAIDIVFEMFEKSETGTVQKSICDSANTSMKLVFRCADRPFDDVYRVNWKVVD